MEPTSEIDKDIKDYKGIPLTADTAEHIPKLFENKYHEVNIRIIEFDHHRSEQAGIIYKMPGNWRQLLKTKMDEVIGPIVPEYCIPDLEFHAYKEGDTLRKISTSFEDVRKIGEMQGITQFFSFVSRTVGSEGRTLLAVDPANKIRYVLLEDRDKARFKRRTLFHGQTWTNKGYFGDYGKIDSQEINTGSVVDARRLLTARGLMQLSLVTAKDQTVVHINTPVHTERIDNYIKRQIDWESQSGIKVNAGQDFRYVSPTEETNKMKKYRKFSIEQNIREYKPTLLPEAYQIDLFFHDQEWDGIDLEQRAREYLNSSPKSGDEDRYRRNLGKALKIITACVSKGEFSKKKIKKISNLIDTNRTGWKLVKKTPIY